MPERGRIPHGQPPSGTLAMIHAAAYRVIRQKPLVRRPSRRAAPNLDKRAGGAQDLANLRFALRYTQMRQFCRQLGGGTVAAEIANVSDAKAALTTAQNKAATAQKTANAKAAATYRSREQALAQMQQTTKQRQAALKRELGEVQASSVSGDGVYVVGKDIKAGTWHTNGSGDTGANDCYFATLNSTDTSDIADNNDFDGPETVDVSSAYAFQIGGPCSWVLVP